MLKANFDFTVSMLSLEINDSVVYCGLKNEIIIVHLLSNVKLFLQIMVFIYWGLLIIIQTPVKY